MRITPDNRLKKLIIIGDRVLVRPTRPNEKTQSGLYLPPGVQEKERVQQGVIKGDRYARTLKYDRDGKLIKDHWERKGKAT